MSFGIGNMGLMAQLMRQYNLPGRRAGGFLIVALGGTLGVGHCGGDRRRCTSVECCVLCGTASVRAVSERMRTLVLARSAPVSWSSFVQ